jgi:brefeldin A-inhibited guanine nucleotide-exchange protein
LENNVRKLSPEKWDSIVSAFVQLFRTTTASQLFEPVLHAEVQPTELPDEDGEVPVPLATCYVSLNADSRHLLMTSFAAPFQKFVAPAPLEPSNDKSPALSNSLTYAEQRRIFKQIIVKCVLQLLLIETTHGLLQNDDVYNTIPAEHLLRFMGVLDDSWRFARRFNADKDLRMKLWKVGECGPLSGWPEGRDKAGAK